MEQSPQKKDSTSLVLMVSGAAVLAVTVYALVVNFSNVIASNSIDSQAKYDYKQQALTEVLQPIGAVTSIDKSLAPVKRSGEQVYAAVCGACHTTGLLGAPKTGSQEDWASRAAVGLDTIVLSAINGKGSMPARGGDPSVTDEEIRDAILHMTKDTQINWDAKAGDDKIGDASTAENSTAAMAMAVDTKTESSTEATSMPVIDSVLGIKIYAANCYVCHDAGAVGSPKLGDAAWAPRIAKGKDVLYDTTINGINAMPARGGNLSLSDDDIKAAVDYMISAVKQ